MRALVVASMLAVLAGCASQRDPNVLNATGLGEQLFADVTTLGAMEDAPEPVRSATLAHVRERAGAFYPQLVFDHGERRIHTQTPSAVPTYLMSFRFSDVAAGIEDYQAEVELDGNGHVVEPLSLPDFRTSPDKMHFATREQVWAVARAEGFGSRRLEVALMYDARIDAIIWEFSQPLHPGAEAGELRTLTVSAHTAEVLDRGTGVYWNH